MDNHNITPALGQKSCKNGDKLIYIDTFFCAPNIRLHHKSSPIVKRKLLYNRLNV